MIEIRNKSKSPIQLTVRSRETAKSFSTLVIPGIGKNKNVYLLEDERMTENITQAKDNGLITIKHIPNNLSCKGE